MVNPLNIQIPIIETIRKYKKAYLRYDLVAGVTVATVAIPQAMAYAGLAGVSITAGLYATLIAMIAFAIFTTTKHVIAGPDAAMAALTGATLIPFAAAGSGHYLALVSLLAILIGISCFAAVISRLGFISEFLSRPILLGYMAGLALAVIAYQIPKLFGMSPVLNSNFFSTVTHIVSNYSQIHIPTLLLSLILGGLSYGLIKLAPKVPLSLIVLVGSILTSAIFGFQAYGIAIIGKIPTGLPLPAIPAVTLNDVQNLIVPAIAVMMVSYANTIATARTFAAKENEHIDSSQEFFSLGAANIASGMFGGIPVAASGSRTAVNHQNEANGQISQLISALTVGLVLLFLARYLKYLPLPALAIIIIAAVSKLFDFVELKSIWHAWRSEAVLAIVTMIGVTILGIFQGLLLAVLLAIGNLIRTSTFPNDAVLGIAEDGSLRDISRPPKSHAKKGIIMYRFDAPLYFGNAHYFHRRVIQLLDKKPDTKWFLWDAETITSIDSTGGAMLLGLARELRKREVVFCIARMKGPIRHTINQTNRLSRILGKSPQFTTMGNALDAFEKSQKN